MRRILLAFGLTFLVTIVISLLALGYTWKRYAEPFFSAAGISPKQLVAYVREGLKTPVQEKDGVVSFLILGVDEVDGRSEGVLTDSIVLALLNLNTVKMTMVSIPRDLWIDEYKTKINALYYYGMKKDSEHPELFPQQMVEKITGLPVQYVLILKLSTVAQLIDSLGGIDVEIAQSFEDDRFPKPGVDIYSEKDPEKLYETVRFEKGVEHMSGERALKYIRSRYSEDLAEGTDDARSVRQQKVVFSTFRAMIDAIGQRDTAKLGRAYRFYLDNFSSVVSPAQSVAIARRIGTNAPFFSFQTYDMTSFFTVPPIKKHKQWVYEPIDPSWQSISNSLRQVASGTISQ